MDVSFRTMRWDETRRDEMRLSPRESASRVVCVHRADERGVNRGRVDRVCASTARVDRARDETDVGRQRRNSG